MVSLMHNKPLLSIIIPSRNRQKYAISCIKSILSINDYRFELVVHDNSDDNKLEALINSEVYDSRLRYIYDSSPMSTVHNFNKAMEYVNGEYLCFIGDDDGVNQEIIEISHWAKIKNLDAVIERTRIGYSWPTDTRNGKMIIYPFSGEIKEVNVDKTLKRFLSDGGIYYLNYDLPKVYHGIIKKECFDKVKRETGNYFGGLSVDIFASVAVSLVAIKVVSIDYPFTIAGNSFASDQTHRTEHAKKMDLKDAPHFREIGNYNWSDNVPPVYTVATIWSESGIQALKALKRDDLINTINQFKLAAYIALENRVHEKFILKEFLLLHKFNLRKFKYQYIKLKLRIGILTKKVTNRVFKTIKGNKTIKIENVQTIEDVAKEINFYFGEINRNFKHFLK